MTDRLIIDANVAHEFQQPSAEAKAILQWIKSKGSVAIGGKNLEELQNTKILPLILALKSAGKAKQFESSQINSLAASYTNNMLVSNDAHIIALAIVSNARLLFSRDQPLQEDFKNPKVLNHPRGKCFTNAASHQHLLY